jgi:hypothetical protein
MWYPAVGSLSLLGDTPWQGELNAQITAVVERIIKGTLAI